ncbi:hypothetical protein AVEN_85456-1 [Araneus ventricosus]|uniref:Uncharacterized protein n=1 Tax=Araneus ventricosus TaxID=182803 RepID=A0A4Y2GVP3_ARAVE|nr:hypothetical protein AVEN_85456-1 [Araneus ventricosus]
MPNISSNNKDECDYLPLSLSQYMCACACVCVLYRSDCWAGHSAIHAIQSIRYRSLRSPTYFSPHQTLFHLERESHTPSPRIYTAFQHSWPSSSNGVAGYPEELNIQTFVPAAPVLIGLSH